MVWFVENQSAHKNEQTNTRTTKYETKEYYEINKNAQTTIKLVRLHRD